MLIFSVQAKPLGVLELGFQGHITYRLPPGYIKGVSATLQIGKYTLSYPRGRYNIHMTQMDQLERSQLLADDVYSI